METRQSTTLRHKLDALSFHEPFDSSSLALVDRLLESFVQATDTVRQLNLQRTSNDQQFEEYEAKVGLCPFQNKLKNVAMLMTITSTRMTRQFILKEQH